MMNPLTLRLVIRGLESKVESITARGRLEDAEAYRASGFASSIKAQAQQRVNLKRMIRRRIKRLESELLSAEA